MPDPQTTEPDEAFYDHVQRAVEDDLNRQSQITEAHLRDVIAKALAAMQALHPSSTSDLSDAKYARLWNATMEMLENA